MDNQHTDPVPARLLMVAIGSYDHHARLGDVVTVTTELADLFRRAGFVQDHPELVAEHVCVRTIIDAVTTWFPGHGPRDEVVAYWTGHGVRTVLHDHLLVGTDTPSDPKSYQAVEPGLLFELLVQSPARVSLLIIDTCFSGMAGQTATSLVAKLKSKSIPPPSVVGRRIGLLTTSHPSRTVTSPVFGAALVKVLADPEAGSASWGRRDARISLRQLQDALDAEIGSEADVHIDWSAWTARRTGWANDDGRAWLPNPAWVGWVPTEVVELQRALLCVTEASAHWDLSHRGLEVGSSGWAFVGRVDTLQKILHWLGSERGGVLIVTGPPGSGKSAVIGRMVTLSTVSYRACAEKAGALAGVPPSTLPLEGLFDAAVHARDKTLLAVLSQLARAFGLSKGEQPEGKAPQTALDDLRTHLRKLGQERRRTIAIDALDEARAGHARSIAQACRELGEIPGVRVLVGVRYSVSGDPAPPGPDRHTRLKQAWPAGAIVDLQDDPNTQVDLVHYVDTRLATRYPAALARQRVAQAIAARAVSGGGYFLYARIVARTLEEAKTLPGPAELPAEATEAFAQDLLARFEPDRVRFDDLLGALAWGFGSGLPKSVWARVASALSGEGAAYETADVNDVLRRAGWHVIESGEDDQSVYRLAHELLNDYYRTRHQKDAAAPRQEIQRRITEALRSVPDSPAGGKDWASAPAYIRTHLANHAAEAGLLDNLLTDPFFLLAAEPEQLLRQLGRARSDPALAAAKVYQQSVHHLIGKPSEEHAPYLDLMAHQCGASDLTNELQRRHADWPWRTLWARWMPTDPHRIVARHGDQVEAVLLTPLDEDHLVVASGGADGLQAVDPIDGAFLWRMSGHRVRALARSELAGRPVVIAGCEDGNLRVWDLEDGTPIGQEFGGHGEGNMYDPSVRAVAATELGPGRQSVVVSGGNDGILQVWDLSRWERLYEPIEAFTGCIQDVKLGSLAGRMVILAAGSTNALKDAELGVWDLATGSLLHRFRPPGVERIHSLAVTEIGERGVIFTGNSPSTVGAWDMQTGATRFPPSPFGPEYVNAVAVGDPNNNRILTAASGSIIGVRLLEGTFWERRLAGHDHLITTLAVGKLREQRLIVSGSLDRTVRVWDLGDPDHHDPEWNADALLIRRVFLCESTPDPLIVSASPGPTVRIWNRTNAVVVDRTGLSNREDEFDREDCPMAVRWRNGKVLIALGGVGEILLREAAAPGQWHGSTISHGNQPVCALIMGRCQGRDILVSGHGDGAILGWDLNHLQAPGQIFRFEEGPAKFPVRQLFWTELQGRALLVSLRERYFIDIWELGTQTKRMELITSGVDALAVMDGPRGPVLVSGSSYGEISLWNLENGEQIRNWSAGQTGLERLKAVGGLMVSGRLVVLTGGGDRKLCLWDPNGSLLTAIEVDSEVQDIAVTPGGEIVVACTKGLITLRCNTLAGQPLTA